MENPNVDPSIRGEQPKVKDLREKFIEIMEEELVPVLDVYEPDVSAELAKAADRMMDAVAQVGMMDPE